MEMTFPLQKCLELRLTENQQKDIFFLTNFDEEAKDDDFILILISSILLQKKSIKVICIKGCTAHRLWFLSKFGHGVEEKSRIVFIIVY